MYALYEIIYHRRYERILYLIPPVSFQRSGQMREQRSDLKQVCYNVLFCCPIVRGRQPCSRQVAVRLFCECVVHVEAIFIG